ncbi:MAG: DUF2029 domain-containing protein [Candidatus Thorarchaeota archaeon]|nr:DUF2029 domain-containing protein [Candidatus Thorarchaeota archaeon]
MSVKLNRHVLVADCLIVLSLTMNIALILLMRFFGSLMYQFFLVFYAWAAVYILFIAALINRQRFPANTATWPRFIVCVAIVSVVATRLVFIGMEHQISLDARWYMDFGMFMRTGNVPYFDFYFPYPPVFAYVILVTTTLWNSVMAFRLLATGMDVIVALLLTRIARHHVGPSWSLVVALAYAFLPMSIIESGWNGHFEPLVNVFVLSSVWFIMNGRYRWAGVSIGVAVATKFYPAFLYPILLFRSPSRTEKIQLTVCALVSGLLSLIPVLVVHLVWPGPSSVNGSSSTGQLPTPMMTLIRTLTGLLSSSGLVNALAILLIAAMSIMMFREMQTDDDEGRNRRFNWTALALGALLIILGLAAAIYPLSLESRMVYWRYPADVGIVRGITTVSLGSLVAHEAYQNLRNRSSRPVSRESMFFLACGTILLLASMLRDVFYGWYLLWSLPLFLVLKNRKLGLTLVLCLLLVYPCFTHDNFAGLGFDEPRIWSDDPVSSYGWTGNVSGVPSLNTSLVTYGVLTTNDTTRFWFDTTSLKSSEVENLSIELVRQVQIPLDVTTEFVALIAASWNPTFGPCSFLTLNYTGTDGTGKAVNGSIISTTNIFTNLTHILWRHAFVADYPSLVNGTITELRLVMHPQKAVGASYSIDFFYTTTGGPLSPVFFVSAPMLLAASLVAYVVLRREFNIGLGPEHG